MAGKLSAGDKETLQKKVTDTISWLEGNQAAEKEEFDHHRKELEQVANPILTRLHGGAPGGAAGGFPGAGAGGAGQLGVGADHAGNDGALRDRHDFRGHGGAARF